MKDSEQKVNKVWKTAATFSSYEEAKKFILKYEKILEEQLLKIRRMNGDKKNPFYVKIWTPSPPKKNKRKNKKARVKNER